MAKRAHEGEESAVSKRLKLDDIQTLEEAKLELQKSIEENEKLQETIETLKKEMEKMKEMSSNKEANVQDDECLVVIVPPHEPVLEKEKEKSPMKPVVKKEVSGNEDEDEDCVIISTKGPQPSDFPHARAHCTLNKFTQTESVDGMFPINKEHCQNCYCFICEIPANDCKNWDFKDGGHCNAHDKSSFWKQKKQQAKKSQNNVLIQELMARDVPMISFDRISAQISEIFQSYKRGERQECECYCHYSYRSWGCYDCDEDTCNRRVHSLFPLSSTMKNIIDTITKNLYLQQNFLVCLAELDALTTGILTNGWKRSSFNDYDSSDYDSDEYDDWGGTGQHHYTVALDELDKIWIEVFLHPQLADDLKKLAIQRINSLLLNSSDGKVGLKKALEVANVGWNDPKIQAILKGEKVNLEGITETPTILEIRLTSLQKQEKFQEALNFAKAGGFNRQVVMILLQLEKLDEAFQYFVEKKFDSSDIQKLEPTFASKGTPEIIFKFTLFCLVLTDVDYNFKYFCQQLISKTVKELMKDIENRTPERHNSPELEKIRNEALEISKKLNSTNLITVTSSLGKEGNKELQLEILLAIMAKRGEVHYALNGETQSSLLNRLSIYFYRKTEPVDQHRNNFVSELIADCCQFLSSPKIISTEIDSWLQLPLHSDVFLKLAKFLLKGDDAMKTKAIDTVEKCLENILKSKGPSSKAVMKRISDDFLEPANQIGRNKLSNKISQTWFAMDPSWLSFQNFQKSVAPESWEQTKKESLTMLKKNWTQYSNASMLELFLMAEEYDAAATIFENSTSGHGNTDFVAIILKVIENQKNIPPSKNRIDILNWEPLAKWLWKSCGQCCRFNNAYYFPSYAPLAKLLSNSPFTLPILTSVITEIEESFLSMTVSARHRETLASFFSFLKDAFTEKKDIWVTLLRKVINGKLKKKSAVVSNLRTRFSVELSTLPTSNIVLPTNTKSVPGSSKSTSTTSTTTSTSKPSTPTSTPIPMRSSISTTNPIKTSTPIKTSNPTLMTTSLPMTSSIPVTSSMPITSSTTTTSTSSHQPAILPKPLNLAPKFELNPASLSTSSILKTTENGPVFQIQPVNHSISSAIQNITSNALNVNSNLPPNQVSTTTTSTQNPPNMNL